MADNVIEIVAKGTDLASSTFKKMGTSLNNTFDKITSSIFSVQGAIGTLTGTAGLGLLGKSVIDASSKVEDFRTRFISLTKSEEEAEAKLKSLSDFASQAPFELEQVIEAGVTLEAFGVTAEAGIGPLGDLAAFMGVDLVDAAQAMGRAFAGGAGAADVLRERGVLSLVSMQTGIDDLTQLSLPEFRRALIESIEDPAGKIAGTTEKLAETFTGQMSMMSDAVFQLRTTLGDALMPAIKELVSERITPLIKSLTDWAAKNREIIQQKAEEAIKKVVDAVGWLVDNYQYLIEVGNGVVVAINAIIGVFQAAYTVGNALGFIILKIVESFAFLTDQLGITEGAQKKWADSADDAFNTTVASAKKTANTFSEVADGAVEIARTVSDLRIKNAHKTFSKISESVEKVAVAQEKVNQATIDFGDKISKEQIKEWENFNKNREKLIADASKFYEKSLKQETDFLVKNLANQFDQRRINLSKEFQELVEIRGMSEELEKAFSEAVKKINDDEIKHKMENIDDLADYNIAQLQRMLDDDELTQQQRLKVWDEVNSKLSTSSLEPFDAFKLGMKSTEIEFDSFTQSMIKLGQDMALALRDGMSDLFFDMFDSEIEDMEESWDKFGESLKDTFFRSISDMASNLVTSNLLSLIPGVSGGGGDIAGGMGAISGGIPGESLVGGATQAAGGLGLDSSMLAGVMSNPIALSAIAAVGAIVLVNSGVIDKILESIVSFVQKIPEIIETFVSKVPELMQHLVDAVIAILMELDDIILAVFEAIPELIISILDKIPELIQQLVEAIPVIIEDLIEAIPVIIEELLEALPIIFEKIVGLLPIILEEAMQLITMLIPLILNKLPKIMLDILIMIPDIVIDILGQLPVIVADIMGQLPQILAEGLANMAGSFGGGGGGGGGGIPFFDNGTPMVTRSGLAVVHQGEAIIPAAEAKKGNFNGNNGGSIVVQNMSLFPNITSGRGITDIPKETLEEWIRREVIPAFNALNRRKIVPDFAK